jgi:hypothetical protein
VSDTPKIKSLLDEQDKAHRTFLAASAKYGKDSQEAIDAAKIAVMKRHAVEKARGE